MVDNGPKKIDSFIPEFESFFKKKHITSRYSLLTIWELETLLRAVNSKMDIVNEYQKRIMEDKNLIANLLKNRRG